MKQNRNPLISVILCFYNEEKFLKEAVESVMAQDYDNWELILVDDGSKDRSQQQAREYAHTYPEKILSLEHPGHANKGLSASRNLGIKSAAGDYVAFIDADDVWLPGKLSQQLGIFRNHPGVTVVLESSKYWRSWSESTEADVEIPVGAKAGLYHPPALMAKLYPLGKGAAPCPSGIMVSRATLRRCNFEESFRGIYQMYEDQAFLCKVYLKETVYVSDACNNLYRQRPSSLVSSVHESGKYHLVRQYYLNWFSDYLSQQPIEFRQVRILLDKALLRYKRPLWHRITVDFPTLLKETAARILVRFGIISYRKSW